MVLRAKRDKLHVSLTLMMWAVVAIAKYVYAYVWVYVCDGGDRQEGGGEQMINI